ncbi:hypothetical protein MHI01_30905 [Paenibacillus sp. FSL M7-0656]|uniref:hypothetical protein n=1 Tax=Paenibacillus sp. FSL M7-0656 TaxID=2921534 RepID=UPI0030F917F6
MREREILKFKKRGVLPLKSEKISIHPGIYRFNWPYLVGSFVPDNTGEIKVHECEVELRAGQRHNLQEGKLLTVIITSHEPPGIQSTIEHIATKIRLAFFDQIFMGTQNNLSEDSILWIEQHLFAKSGGVGSRDFVHEVSMQWDKKREN